MRASGSFDRRLCVAVAAGPVCGCWPLSSSVSAPRFSSSLPLRLVSSSVGLTDVTNVVAILFLSKMLISKINKGNTTVYQLHVTNDNISWSDHACASGLSGRRLCWLVGRATGSPAYSCPANYFLKDDWPDCYVLAYYWLDPAPFRVTIEGELHGEMLIIQ